MSEELVTSMDEPETTTLINWAKPTAELRIGGKNGLRFRHAFQYPNAFHRLVQKLLLGFEWERIKETSNAE